MGNVISHTVHSESMLNFRLIRADSLDGGPQGSWSESSIGSKDGQSPVDILRHPK
jgi:hypothetical protein